MHYDNEPLFMIRRDKGVYKMPEPHFHTYHELYFLVSGKTKYFVNGEIFMLSPGDLIFIPKGDFHQTNYPDPDNIERVTIVFNDEFWGEEFKSYVDILSAHKYFRIPKDRINIFHGLIRQIEAEESNKEKDYINMEKFYLGQLLIMILRYREKEQTVKLSYSCQLAQDAAKYINANYNKELTLESMAEKYSVNADYFSKISKKATGVGFSKYLNATRLSAAQEMLATTTVSITDVALECGFNDSNYFIQVFKKVHGMTPKKYSMQFRLKK